MKINGVTLCRKHEKLKAILWGDGKALPYMKGKKFSTTCKNKQNNSINNKGQQKSLGGSGSREVKHSSKGKEKKNNNTHTYIKYTTKN